ncbi:catalase HPII, partial [Streptomyces cinereoruber]
AQGARDAKAGEPGQGGAAVDPRLAMLVSEAFRHAKAIGGWAGAETVLAAASVPTGAPGVILADSGEAVLSGLTPLLAKHRVWDRFPAAL